MADRRRPPISCHTVAEGTHADHRRAAFSLVELLVVIGVVAFLVSLLLPALSKARRSADAMVCLSSLRQVGVAMFAYATAHAGHLPQWSNKHVYPDGSSPFDQPGPGWPEQLVRFGVPSPDSPLYHCPSFPPGKQVTYFLEGRWLAMQDPVRHGYKQSDVRTSDTFLLAGECTASFYYPQPFGAADPNPDDPDDIDKDDATQHVLLFYTEGGGINMHPAGNNVLFADGHAALLRTFDPSLLTFHPKRPGIKWKAVGPD